VNVAALDLEYAAGPRFSVEYMRGDGCLRREPLAADSPRLVLGVSGALIRFAGDDGTVEEAPVAGLAGSGRLRPPPRGSGGELESRVGPAGLSPDAVERARWWEARIIEIVDGSRPDPAGRLRR
jgi:hypothetical protein